jgi:hypothetical protein
MTSHKFANTSEHEMFANPNANAKAKPIKKIQNPTRKRERGISVLCQEKVRQGGSRCQEKIFGNG